MTVNYGSDRESDSSKLIEDVIVPVGRTGFNVRHDKVRRQSIGRLEQDYLRSRGAAQSVAAPTKPSLLQYTRIPPMPVLHHGDYSDGASRVAFAEFLAGIVQFCQRGLKRKALHMGWLPKRYSAARGLYTDWHTKTFSRLKWVTPLFFLMIGLLAFVLTDQQPNRGSLPHAGHHVGRSGGAVAASASGSKPTATSKTAAQSKYKGADGSGGSLGSSSGGATALSAGKSGAGSTAVTAPLTGTTTFVGGMGGGSTTGGGTTPTNVQSPPVTVTAPVSTPTLPSTTTVTVPPLQLQSDGKPLIGTSGVTGTLN